MNYLMSTREFIAEYTKRQLVQEYGIDDDDDSDSDTITNFIST